jgi:hypothetical protein
MSEFLDCYAAYLPLLMVFVVVGVFPACIISAALPGNHWINREVRFHR